MATNFPTSLDALTNPTSSDSLASPSHSSQHANVNDAVEALQAKVGVDSSAVTSSLDYKVAQLEAQGTYTDYSGSVTGGVGLTVGNGTWDFAGYAQVQDLVIYQIEFTLGSTSSISGNIAISLPVTSRTSANMIVGVGSLIDTGTALYPAHCRLINTTNFVIQSYYAAVATAQQQNSSASVPFTWTSGDRITATVIYQAA